MTDDRTPPVEPADEREADLASAYLDGELDDAERSNVEADPAVLARVDHLRELRALLSDVEPPPISLREQQLAAALDAWDRIPDAERTGAISDATPSIGSRRRRRTVSTAWMGVAAAAMLVVAGAAVVLQATGGGDDSDGAGGGADEVSLDAAATESDDAAAESAESEAAREATAALGELAGGDTEEAAEIVAEAIPEGGIDTGIDTPAPPVDVPLEELFDTEQLRIFALDAIGAPVASDVEAPEADSSDAASTGAAPDGSSDLFELRTCGSVDLLVGPASYLGQDVVVGVDLERDLAFAHDLVTCVEVARVALP